MRGLAICFISLALVLFSGCAKDKRKRKRKKPKWPTSAAQVTDRFAEAVNDQDKDRMEACFAPEAILNEYVSCKDETSRRRLSKDSVGMYDMVKKLDITDMEIRVGDEKPRAEKRDCRARNDAELVGVKWNMKFRMKGGSEDEREEVTMLVVDGRYYILVF